MLLHILNNIIFYKPILSMLLITEVFYFLLFIIIDYNLNYLSQMLSYCGVWQSFAGKCVFFSHLYVVII